MQVVPSGTLRERKNIGDNPKLQYISHLDRNFLSHVDHLVFDDFEELIDINRFRKQGGDGQGCVRHEGGPLWALRGYTKGERLVLYQVGSSLYALIHFSRKIFLFQDKEKDRYSPMMNGFVAVFLYYQYQILSDQQIKSFYLDVKYIEASVTRTN